MRSSIATYKESLSRIASEVLDAADELEDAGADSREPSPAAAAAADGGSPSPAVHGRRTSRRFSESRSPAGSPAANGTNSDSKDEITKYKADIQKLQASEAEIKALSFSYAAMLKEKEEQLSRLLEENGSLRRSLEDKNIVGSPRTLSSSPNLSKGMVDTLPMRQNKHTSLGNVHSRGNLASNGTLSKHEGLNNGVVLPNQTNGMHQKNNKKVGNLEAEGEFLHTLEENDKTLASIHVDIESEIRQLRAQLAKEHVDTVEVKTRLQEERQLNESSQKELECLKKDKERASIEMEELRKELNKKIEELQQLQEELNKRKSERDSFEYVENLKTLVNELEEENGRLKAEKVELEKCDDASVSGSSGQSDQLNKLEKSLNDAYKDRDKAIQELARLKQHLLDQELDEANKMDEDNQLIEDLRSKIEYQRAHILNLEKALKQEAVKGEEMAKLHQQELHKLNDMINGMSQKLANCLKAIDSKNVELLNLQTALGQYYAESEAKEKLGRDLAASKEECAKLAEMLKLANVDMEKLQGEKGETASKIIQAETALSDSKLSIKKLEEDNSKLRRALEQSMTRLNRMSLDSDNYVDRRIVIKLLVTYFQRNHSKEVLDLIVRMLGFSEEEKQAIARLAPGKGVVRGVLGLPGRLVGGIIGGGSHEARSLAPSDNQSFADLWVDFLLKETEERERREMAEAARSSAAASASTSAPTAPGHEAILHSPANHQSSASRPPLSGGWSVLFEHPDGEFATVPLTSSSAFSPPPPSRLLDNNAKFSGMLPRR